MLYEYYVDTETLMQIADRYGVSESRISQILTEARRKMRRILETEPSPPLSGKSNGVLIPLIDDGSRGGRVPVGPAYRGRPDRPEHILAARKAGERWEYLTLCRDQVLDAGTPTWYAPERVAEIATCRRCLERWAGESKPWSR